MPLVIILKSVVLSEYEASITLFAKNILAKVPTPVIVSKALDNPSNFLYCLLTRITKYETINCLTLHKIPFYFKQRNKLT